MNDWLARLSYTLGHVVQRQEVHDAEIQALREVTAQHALHIASMTKTKRNLTLGHVIGLAQVVIGVASFIITWKGGILAFWQWVKNYVANH